MKKHYYLTGSLIGILCAFLLAYYLMGEHFLLMLSAVDSQKYYGFWGPLTGALTVLVCAVILDSKKIQISYLISGLLLPVLIFTAGMIDGCLVNWAINGKGMVDFQTWFFIPFAWLGMIGIPAAAIVGSLYYFVTKRFHA